jgi:eukaryotic-like serine/threonine-protein kinase
MTPELWQRLKPLFHAALDREPGKRAQFIDEACADDAELKLHLNALIQAEEQAAESLDQQFPPEKRARMRIIYAKLLNAPEGERIALAHRLCEGDAQIESETQRLISAHDKAGKFRYEPQTAPLSDAGLESAGRNLSPGTLLASRFRILRPLDSGGMGSVYEAWDSELQETLALKTILPEIASEPSVIERFKREVKQAHQVTHPNICRVYDLFNHDFGPGDRIWFLTMQLLKGSTLLEHIRKKGPFTCKEGLALVEQMVAGLTAAHEHGIVHRDFKSSNVMLVQETKHSIRAVITDFGLASQATTHGQAGNLAGQGTPAYVAPEQWFEGIVAPAGDQYSLGVVMCEMLTGERPAPAQRNQGNSAPARLPVGKKLDARWEFAIRRSLEIKPENRFATLDELLAAIDPRPRRRRVIRWVVSTATVVLVAITGLLINNSMNQLPSLTGLTRLTPAMSFSEGPKLSSDGKTIAYVSDRAEAGNMDVFVQRLPDGIPKRITTDPAMDENPAVSPNGHLVAFESSRSRPGIYLADVDKGGERLLVPDGHEPSFSPDGRKLLYWTGDVYGVQPSAKIFLLDLNTGRSIQLASGMVDPRNPVWNSDGVHILFSGCADTTRPFPTCKDWWVTTTDGAAPRETGAIAALLSHGVIPNIYFGGWQGDTIAFSAKHNGSMGLWELKLNAATAKVSGVAKQLISGDNRDFIIDSSLVGNSLAICEWSPAIHIWQIKHPEDPKLAKLSEITTDPEFDLGPSISHNGRWLVFARGYSENRKIYLRDTQSGQETSLPLNQASKYSPIIDDAGETIAFEASEHNVPSVWVGNTSGTERQLCSECRNPTGWLSEPKAVLYSNTALSEVRMQPIDGGTARTILSVPGGSVRDAVWSPESHFILFTVSKPDSEGRIYAARFLPGAAAPDWIEISAAKDYCRKPQWSGDGKTIFYLSNLDGFWCIWGQHFNPALGRTVGPPFIVQHFHEAKFSPTGINASAVNMSAAGDSLYLNVLETGGSIWVGKVATNPFFSHFR